jgi:transcriptional regulator with XRE-family HTH domain
MPSIDRDAKAYEMTRAGWFGTAVSWRRNALKLTASELSRRTAELGYPISRGAIAKIESNVRSGKIDVAEVLVLAAALDIPPVLLLFPQLATDGGAVVLPGLMTSEDEAVRWMSGGVSFPQNYDLSGIRLEGQPNPPNEGVKLIAAVSSLQQTLEARIPLLNEVHKAQADWDDVQANWEDARANLDDVHARADRLETARRTMQLNDERIAAIQKEIRDARKALWSMSPELDDEEGQSDG